MPEPSGPAQESVARRRWLTAGVAAAALLSGAGVAWWRLGKSADGGADGDLGALWALRVERPEGGELALARLRGQPLLINFWATWCAPCIREMPQIDRFHREFGPRGWQVVGLAIDGPAAVRAFLERVPVGFAIGLAGLDGAELVRHLGNPQGGLPFTVMISADGRLLRRKLGETNFAELSGWATQAS